MRIEISISPMGAVRTTKKMAGKTAAGRKYADYKSFIAWNIRQQVKEPLEKAIRIKSMMFEMPIPKSLKTKVAHGQMHTKKPDIDNLIKGVFDAANGVAWVDDNRIAELGTIRKYYSDNPKIILEFEEVGELVHGQVARPAKSGTLREKIDRKKRTEERKSRKSLREGRTR